MGQGRGAYAQSAFFLAGLLFLRTLLRDSERGMVMSMQSSDVVECEDLGSEASGNVSVDVRVSPRWNRWIL